MKKKSKKTLNLTKMNLKIMKLRNKKIKSSNKN